MTKDELVASIEEYHTLIVRRLAILSIPNIHLFFDRERFLELKHETLVKAEQWIRGIIQHDAYRSFVAIYTDASDSYWKTIISCYADEDLPEHERILKAAKELRKTINTAERPNCFKRSRMIRRKKNDDA